MERLPSTTILSPCSSQTPKQMFALELKNTWMRRSKKDEVHISDITLDCICHYGISISFSVHIIFFLRNKTMLFEYFVMSKPIHTNRNAHPDHPHRRCALLFSQQSRSVRSCRPENRGIGSRAEVTTQWWSSGYFSLSGYYHGDRSSILNSDLTREYFVWERKKDDDNDSFH